MPGMSGIRGVTPVASTTSSKPASSSTSARVSEPHVDAVLVEHPRVVADRLAELLLAGNPSGHVELAADHVARLEQRDVVAALRGGHRGRPSPPGPRRPRRRAWCAGSARAPASSRGPRAD